MNNYQVDIGKYIKEGWDLFMKAPEVFVVSTIGYFLFAAIFSFLPFVGALLNVALSAVFAAAMMLEADYVKKEGKGSFEIMKNSKDYFAQIIILSIVSGIIYFFAFLLLVLPFIYLVVAYSFGKPMVVFKGKSFWDAMEASRKLVHKNWFAVFALLFVNVIILISGFLFLGIGCLITMPLASLIMYCAFIDITTQAGV